MQLFGVSKTAFDGFLAAFIYPLAPRAQPVGVDLLKALLPDMACDDLGVIATLRASIAQRAGSADLRVALVFPISGTVGGAVSKDFKRFFLGKMNLNCGYIGCLL